MFELFKNSSYGASALKAAQAGDTWTAAALMQEFIEVDGMDLEQACNWLHSELPNSAA
jgi:hypothetical protein